jgi:hypothetical protein
MPEQTTFPSAANTSFASLPAPDDQNIARWKEYLRPTEDELRWQEVPWRSSFWEGVLEAQEKELPLLIWAMNGHPLACT